MGTLQEYINKLKRISNNLTKLSESPSDSSFITALFISLPESYSNLIMALEAQKDLTSTYVIRKLLEEERKWRENDSILSITAFKAKTQQKRQPKTKVYNYCHNIRHTEDEC